MAGILDGIVSGLAKFAPQDEPDVKIFNAQNELKEIEEKENSVYAELGRKIYLENGKEAYPDTALQIEALAANKAAVEEKINQFKAEKEEKERAEAEAEKERARLECPNCGTVNSEGCKFCSSCGTKLITEEEAPRKRFCTSCGVPLGDGMKFCTSCGAKYE